MRESVYQSDLIKRLKIIYPGVIILKNDPTYIQGIPDLSIFFEDRWAMLEVKPSAKAPAQPNQEYYVEYLNSMSYSSFVFPENEHEVLSELQYTFGARR